MATGSSNGAATPSSASNIASAVNTPITGGGNTRDNIAIRPQPALRSGAAVKLGLAIVY